MSRDPDRWDVVVAGAGAMGSAALFHLARRGRRVLGLERFEVPNDRASHHGGSRIIRLAYFEDPRYVPLVRRAFELWRELERISGERLMRVTGSLDAGPPGSALFEGSMASCEAHDIPHEVLDAAEVARRYPAFRLPATTRVLFQPDGAVLAPELCVETHARFGESMGATVRSGIRVTGWEPGRGGGVEVLARDEEGREQIIECERLVLSMGAWMPGFLDLTGSRLFAERQVVGWLRPFTRRLFSPERFPVFNLEAPEGHYYGFPDLDGTGLKVGRFHHREERVDPDRMDRTATAQDHEVIRDFVERYLPEGAGQVERMETCLFTNTPDKDFILDHLPGDESVVVAAGFSGHGFKFAPVVGEILADLALEGTTDHDIGLFRITRFQRETS